MKGSTRCLIVLLIAAAVLVPALSSGCAGPSTPEGGPSIRGVVTDISPLDNDEAIGSIRVVWTQDPDVGVLADHDAAQLTVTTDTAFERVAPDGKSVSASFENLRTLDIVDVWFTDGPVAESYPVQAGAAHVLIRGTFGGTLPTPPGLAPPSE